MTMHLEISFGCDFCGADIPGSQRAYLDPDCYLDTTEGRSSFGAGLLGIAEAVAEHLGIDRWQGQDKAYTACERCAEKVAPW